MSVRPIPEGVNTVTPHIVVRNAVQAIDFYKVAFGAKEVVRHMMPGGQQLMHAEIKIGDSSIFMAEENPHFGTKSPLVLGGTPIKLHLFVEQCDLWYQRAVDAGCHGAMPPADMFWGDRYCVVVDPYGHEWAIATHVRDVTPEESARAMAEMFAQGPPQ